MFRQLRSVVRSVTGRWTWSDAAYEAHKIHHAESLQTSADIDGLRELPIARPRKQRAKNTETIGKLLDDLDGTFSNIARKSLPYGTHPSTRKALRNMGPTVTPFDLWQSEHLEQKVDVSRPLSSTMFLSINEGGLGNAVNIYIDFMYAHKLKKPPIGSETFGDVCYEFGVAFRRGSKHEWSFNHVGVNTRTGEIRTLKDWAIEQVKIPAVRKPGIRYESSYFSRKVFGLHPAFRSDRQEPIDLVISGSFARLVYVWQDKATNWSVSTRKDGYRVTFLVSPEKTKTYFKDRDRTAFAPNGTKKKIIHYVHEHKRIVSGKETTVREHIRGLRRFSWNGYECAVTAPKFHRWVMDSVQLAGVLLEDEIPTEKMVGMEVVIKEIALLEDEQPKDAAAFLAITKSKSFRDSIKSEAA